MRKLVNKPKNGHSVKGCSNCAWTFEPIEPARGSTIGEMAENFAKQCQIAFEKHVCKKEN